MGKLATLVLLGLGFAGVILHKILDCKIKKIEKYLEQFKDK